MIISLITINLFNYTWQKQIYVKYLPKSAIPYNFCFLMYNLHKLKIIMGIIMRKRGSNFNQIWQVKGYLLFFRSTQYVQNMGHPLTSWKGDVFRRYHVPQLFCFLESLFCDTQNMVFISRTSDSLWTNTVFIDVYQKSLILWLGAWLAWVFINIDLYAYYKTTMRKRCMLIDDMV